MTHLTNKQRTELLIQLAQEATGLTVEAKGNPPEADIDTWDMLRKKTKRGTNIMIPLNCRWNTASILRNDPRYSSLCYNEHSDQILLNGEMVSDVTLEVIALNFEEHYRYRVTDKALRASVIMVAQERAIEPIKDWLSTLIGKCVIFSLYDVSMLFGCFKIIAIEYFSIFLAVVLCKLGQSHNHHIHNCFVKMQ